MEGLGSKLVGAMQFAAGGLADTQTAAANAQVLAQNARLANKERDRQLAAKIAESSSYKHFNFNPNQESGALSTVDMIAFAKEDPKLAAEYINSIGSQVFKYTDEKGRLRQGRAAGIAPSSRTNEAGEPLYAVEVERDDGKKTNKGRNPPMTEGASARGDDNVMYFTAAELNGMSNNRLWEMKANNAWDNGSKFGRDMAQLTDQLAVDRAIERGAFTERLKETLEAKGTDPEIVRGILDVAYRLPDDEEGVDKLIEMAEDVGMDVEALFAELAAAKAAEGAEGEAEAARDTTGLGNSETMLGDLSKAVDGVKGFFANPGETMQNIAGLGAITGNKEMSAGERMLMAGTAAAAQNLPQGIFGGGQPDEPVADAPPKDPNAPTLSDVKDRVEGVIPASRIDPGSEANPVFADAVRAGVEAITPALKGMWDRVTGAAPVDSKQSTFSPDTLAAPPEVQKAMLGEGLSPEERRQALLGALETTLAKPTGKAVEYVADYMMSNGFTTPESLSNAPSAEAMNIVFTIAANADVATSADRLKIAQSLLNFVQFGNTETTAQDVADTQIAAARLRQDQLEFAAKTQGDLTTKANEAYEEAAGRAEIIRKSISTKPRMFWQKNPLPSEAIQEFGEILTRAQNSRDPVKAAEYQAVAGEIMPEVLAAFIISEPRADITEAITGSFQDLWLRAPYRKLTTDAGDFRITYKKDGKTPEFLFLVTPKGDDAEGGQINMLQLRGMFGREVADYMIQMIEKTGELKNEQK